MINRRHIRIKVMQAIYSLLVGESDKLDEQEVFLKDSIERLHQLYTLQLQLLVALFEKANQHYKASKKKYLKTDSHLETSSNFINNLVLIQLKNSPTLKNYPKNKKDVSWENQDNLVTRIWEKITKSNLFNDYTLLTTTNYQIDKKFIINIFKDIIAPNQMLAEFYEDEVISWVDDIPFTNTLVLKNLNKLKSTTEFNPERLYKDFEDKQFVIDLFQKATLNFSKYEKDIDLKTPNWDTERITKVDKILMIMSITEFFHFPSIPTKVSINEYIEIAKDYATPKSSFFINGVLDKLLDDYIKDKKIKKIGRGLL